MNKKLIWGIVFLVIAILLLVLLTVNNEEIVGKKKACSSGSDPGCSYPGQKCGEGDYKCRLDGGVCKCITWDTLMAGSSR